MWEKVPYARRGLSQNWDFAKDSHGKAVFQLWSQFAPNLTPETVIDSFTRSPLDTERRLPNMRSGDLLVGSLGNNKVGYNRPFAGAGEYRTPGRGLYFCGGSTPPGGHVTRVCG